MEALFEDNSSWAEVHSIFQIETTIITPTRE